MDKESNQTLEQTLKNMSEKNSSIQSERKSVICKVCNKNEATLPIDSSGWYGFEICQGCRDEKYKRKMIAQAEAMIAHVIPVKYREIESDQKESFNDLKDMSIFLTGNPGTGKTVFSCSLAKRYMRKGYDVKFISFPAFIMEMQSSYKKSEENPFEIAESVAKFSGVLVIDDLGAEKLTDFVKQIIYFIINEREQRCLTTIITSNFSLSELDSHIDARISSRISGMCKVIKLTGKDRRLSEQK